MALSPVGLNLKHGGGARWEKIADIIVFSQWRAGAAEKERWAASLGMSWKSATNGEK
jgi:hypothetical protein